MKHADDADLPKLCSSREVNEIREKFDCHMKLRLSVKSTVN